MVNWKRFVYIFSLSILIEHTTTSVVTTVASMVGFETLNTYLKSIFNGTNI